MRDSYERLSLFIKLNFGISLLLLFSFLIFNDYTFQTFLFTVAAAISPAAILYLILYFFIAPLFFLKKKMLFFAALGFAITNLLLVIDFFIFRLWHFHINGMVINIMLSPAAYDSVKTGWGVKISVVAIIAALIYLQYYLIKHVSTVELAHVKRRNRKFFVWIFPALFILVFSEKVVSGFAVMYANTPLLERTKVIPLYLGVDFTDDMEKHFGLKANTSKKQKLKISEKSRVTYPLEELTIDKKNPVNIFVFAMDSSRYSIFDENVTPNISKFSKDSWVYHNHFTGGNSTRFGIFTLWYGLNANYWFSFLNAQKGPVFFDILNKLDYQTHIFSSPSTVWPEFRKTTYFDIQDKINDDYDKGFVQNDIDASNDFVKWLDKVDKKKPMFSFVFLDAPHAPYSYPKEFNKFSEDDNLAKNTNINYLTVSGKDKKRLISKYKNANYFSDSIVHKMITALKKKGLYENSIIVITSDHGEEFYENGDFGHNGSFNRPQSQVPFIVHWPGGGHKDVKQLSSHLDFAPSVLKYIGVKTDPIKYSMGKDLRDNNIKRDYVFCWQLE